MEQLGPYRLTRRIGRGGMGTVFEGLNVETNQPAAIKVLNPHLAVEEGFRERFEIEIETLKKLKHPNIVRLYGFGEEHGVIFYAMELVHGTNLEDELQAGRRFNWRETTGLGIKLARALQHAHDHGVIHRDLKPANLLLTPESDVKLADFGIARLFGNTRLTSAGGLVGTAEYMAPEQADGRVVTPQCDLYSLGGVLFATLAGRPPFWGASLPEVLQMHRFTPPPPVVKYAPDVPAELGEIIGRLLSKEPAARGTNARVVAKQLAAMEHALSMPRTSAGTISKSVVIPGPTGTAPAPLPKTAQGRIPQATVDLPSVADSRDATRPDRVERPGLPPTMAASMPSAPAESAFVPQSPLVAPISNKTGDGQKAGNHTAPSLPQSLPSARAKTVGAGSGGPTAGRPAAGGQDVSFAVSDASVADPAAAGSAAHAAGGIYGTGAASVLSHDHLPVPQSVTPTVSRFITVEEDERRRVADEESRHETPWAQIILLSIALASIIGLGVYLIVPPSADTLYTRIENAVGKSPTEERLLDAESNIESFLKRFPNDPRSKQVKGYADEIDLVHLKRQVELSPLLIGATRKEPIERDDADAMNDSADNPDQAIAKLRAILELYGHAPDKTQTTQQYLELARQQLATLVNQVSNSAPEYLKLIDANLARAEQLRTSNPAEARAIWASIVELYGDKPWAAARVAKAKAALDETAAK